MAEPKKKIKALVNLPQYGLKFGQEGSVVDDDALKGLIDAGRAMAVVSAPKQAPAPKNADSKPKPDSGPAA